MKIFLINDMNYDFAMPDGKLYVPGGEGTISFLQEYIDNISTTKYDYILVVNDLHFSGEYEKSKEGEMFPEHCMYGSKGASIVVDLSSLKSKGIPVYFMNKNSFSMWSKEKTDHLCEVREANKGDEEVIKVYKNLFCISNNRDDVFIHRDKFFPISLCGWRVDIAGLAADYCVRYAIEGFLERGSEVRVFAEMTKGINKDIYKVEQEINNKSLSIISVFR